MKPEEKDKLKKNLVEIYEGYIKEPKNKEITDKAQKLFFNYIYTNNVLDREFIIAIHGLEHIGWEFSRGLKTPNSNWKMSEKEAKEIFEKIK